jgi:predicted aspartyl protease
MACKLGKRQVQVLVDTGSDRTLVDAKLVQRQQEVEGESVPVRCVHGDTLSYPVAEVKLQVDGIDKVARVVVVPSLPVPVLLGRDLLRDLPEGDGEHSFAVVMRSGARKAAKVVEGVGRHRDELLEEGEQEGVVGLPESEGEVAGADLGGEDVEIESSTPGGNGIVEKLDEIESDSVVVESVGSSEGDVEVQCSVGPVVSENLQAEQQADPSLERIWVVVGQGEVGSERVRFIQRDGLIYRVWQSKGTQPGDVCMCEQLVLPQKYRKMLLRLAHDVPMGGHLGITKTKDRILAKYYWSGVFQEVVQYCRSCEVCRALGLGGFQKLA